MRCTNTEKVTSKKEERSGNNESKMFRLGKTEKDFQELYRTHYGRVHRTIQGMTGNSSVAEELTQEAFLKAWKGLPQFGFKSSMKTWLFQVAINTGRDWLRTHRHTTPLLVQESQSCSLPFPESKAVQEALLELELEMRELLILHYYEGLKLDEISDILKIPMGTVKSRLYTAKRTMRQLLLGKGFEV
jgi:RNA polymerase sigma-70 factor, ECF subfamily